MANYLDEAIAALRKFEGSVPWMYLDTVGKVTTGVGLMLPSLEAARSLPFLRGDRAATLEEIGKEYKRVSAMKPGLLAKLYQKASGLTLSDETINERLHHTLIGFEGYLRSHIPTYDTLPDAAKLGLLDMIYNLGPGRLFSEYPRLLNAIAAGDWKAAAAASVRRGPAAARNSWTQQQFADAATVLKSLKATAEGAAKETVLGGLLTALGAAVLTTVLLDRRGAIFHGAASARDDER